MNSVSVAVALVLCFAGQSWAYSTDSESQEENDIYYNIPKPNLENLAKLEYYINITKLTPYTKHIVETGIARIKRGATNNGPRTVKNRGGTQGDNSHWCCKEDPVLNKEYHTRVVRELVPVTKTRRTSGRCGFGGWSRCTRDQTYTTLELVTKTVVDTREVPAPEWINGCPDRKIVCCRGFVLNKFVNNCMTAAEVDELLGVLGRHRDAFDLLEAFGSG